MTASQKIAILAGDGIGPEVVEQAKRVLVHIATDSNIAFEINDALIGGIAYDETGTPLPDDTVSLCKNSDAILLGAVGGPKWDNIERELRPERGLLGIRKALDLFANLRPAMVFDALVNASSLKPELIHDLDIMIVRELTSGIYFGKPAGIETLENGDRKGYNTLVYTTPEIRRIGEVAFDLAQKRSNRVCSVDKANVLVSTELWREEITTLHDESYPNVELSHMYVDNASMQLVRDPKQFDVIVTTNMFGDILSDCAAMLTGSLGMLPSASLSSPGKPGLYEPVHGSAPDIAGEDIANPLATILSLSMMLRYSLALPEQADRIDQAVNLVLQEGYRTKDIFETGTKLVGTHAMGDAIITAMQ